MNNFEDLMNHESALTVSCQECKSAIGESCTRIDIKGQRWPLVNFPAHHSRLKRTERIKRLQEFDEERSKALGRGHDLTKLQFAAPEGSQAVGIAIEDSRRGR
ncbi:hypothetical protein R4P64_07815 [Rhodococcus sp. IEGM 1366]|uniref:zinc finger domain-containing protein n=1 Tax=Rhodococcus sp. IEGM 1366 TaxID=3082223 RepID=UPI002953A461|nr:hypothetical protein [Rhodococcus sp. IEGM 1366]MDV8066407.1 hypothetical protein [Rhodococcus sp. IEGM 1366]